MGHSAVQSVNRSTALFGVAVTWRLSRWGDGSARRLGGSFFLRRWQTDVSYETLSSVHLQRSFSGPALSLSLISCLNFNFSLSPATTLNRRSTVRASAAASGQAEPLPAATFSQQYLISSRWLFCLRGKSRSLWTIYEQAIHDDNDSNNYGWKSTECLPLPRRITQLYFPAKCDNKKTE